MRPVVYLGGTFLLCVTLAWFSERAVNEALSTWPKTLWWGFITATTVGYGDQVPMTIYGKLIGVVLVIVGLTGAGLISGGIASSLVGKVIREGKGVIHLDEMKNHFVILGWKKEMGKVLSDILERDDSLTSDEIVVVGLPTSDEVDAVRGDERFEDLVFVKGDYTDESVIKRVRPKFAKKALILADDAQGGLPTEVDSRSILAAISVHSLAPNLYLCAELLNRNLEKHLKNAHVNEILYSREYSRGILANAAVNDGFSIVLQNLMDPTSPVSLKTCDVPDGMIGSSFKEAADKLRDLYGSIAIGVLENTGNENTMRQEALLEAQRTPDVQKLVSNLKKVREIIYNNPIINPVEGYEIKEHSKMIIIDRDRKVKDVAA
jgi:voltage-gated potassium channel